MKRFSLFALTLGFCAPSAYADGSVFDGTDVVFLGEIHDNPAHHARQAELVGALKPVALVFEMLTNAQSAQIQPEDLADPDQLAQTLGWADSGWPDFAMYYPIFQAAPDAAIFGAALPRDEAHEVGDVPLAKIFGPSAGFYGLDTDLPPPMQAAREQLQMAAHCDSLPVEMLPMMVNIQRLRDARLAETALEAFSIHGGPVVVITGNGHARTDWGAPALVAIASPEVSVAALGQGETDSPPDGTFDLVETTTGVDRGDPCAAFATPDAD